MTDSSLVVLDTDIIIDYLVGKKEARMAILDLFFLEKIPSTTVINVTELFRGISNRKWGSKRKAQLESFLESIHLIDYNQSAAELIGDLLAQLDAQGSPIGFADTAIAGLCLYREASLLTNNSKHFSKIPTLSLYENY